MVGVEILSSRDLQAIFLPICLYGSACCPAETWQQVSLPSFGDRRSWGEPPGPVKCIFVLSSPHLSLLGTLEQPQGLSCLDNASPEHYTDWWLLGCWYNTVLVKFFISLACDIDPATFVIKVNIHSIHLTISDSAITEPQNPWIHWPLQSSSSSGGWREIGPSSQPIDGIMHLQPHHEQWVHWYSSWYHVQSVEMVSSTGHSVETQWKVDLQVVNCPMDHKATPMGPMLFDTIWHNLAQLLWTLSGHCWGQLGKNNKNI